MSVVDGHASFEVLSTQRTGASITEHLNLAPSTAREVGEPLGRYGRGRPSENALWSLDRDGDGIEPLDAALAALLREFDGREELLGGLRDSCLLRVRCYGSSNSDQGGFWLSPEVMQGLGRLGVEFHCTVYLDPPDPEEA